MEIIGASRRSRSAIIAACAVAFFAIGCENKTVDPQFDDEAAVKPQSEILVADLPSNDDQRAG